MQGKKNDKKAWDSDRELVDRILAGSREDFDLLYETYFPRVYRFALKRLRDPGDAEDVAQEVFLTLITALADINISIGAAPTMAVSMTCRSAVRRDMTSPTWALA